MEYREYLPSSDLSQYIKCYWTILTSEENDLTKNQRRIIPDGCSDIIFNFSDRCDFECGGQLNTVKEFAMYLGTQSTPIFLRPNGESYALGVRFQPGAAFKVFKSKTSDLANQLCSLKDIVGSQLDEFIDLIHGHGMNTAKQLQTLNTEFRRIFRDVSHSERTIIDIARKIQGANGRGNIEDLADVVGLSRQFMTRSFQKQIGLGTKTFCRVIKINGVLDAVEASSSAPDWLSLVHDHGYYDQSHLIGEFRNFTGMSPSAYLSGLKNPVSFHFSNTSP